MITGISFQSSSLGILLIASIEFQKKCITFGFYLNLIVVLFELNLNLIEQLLENRDLFNVKGPIFLWLLSLKTETFPVLR